MAGYWPFFFCVFMVEVHKHAEQRGNAISSHVDRTSLVTKGFIIWGKTPKMIFDLVGPNEKFTAGKLAPSYSLR